MNNTAFDLKKTQNHSVKGFKLKKLSKRDSATKMAERILAEVKIFRRTSESMPSCSNIDCLRCTSPHLPKIISAVKHNKPIRFVLPAFPGKSPNPEKVLGPLPDLAEKLSLHFLGNLCLAIKKFYTPGIKIILCSDGRVFSDVVGMKENNVTDYQIELDKMIEEMSLSDISTFNLDDFYKGLHFVQMRTELMKTYGKSLDFFKQKVHKGAKPEATPDELEVNRMYRGITRFIFEDAMYNGQTKTRSAIQKESRYKAYEVIRRSNAWSQLIAEHFPEAVRLSIHPQTCGSTKLGIRLIRDEIWMTPWHGVALESKEHYVLMKRCKAESLGAKLIYSSDGRHSHFKLPDGVNYE